MRTLTTSEVDQVTGGALNLGTGLLGAGIGGLGFGGAYALSTVGSGTFSWGTFAGKVLHGSASGFLVGTGSTLIYAGATGVIKGATPAGVTLAGVGSALAIAPSAPSGSGSGTGEGGGSD